MRLGPAFENRVEIEKDRARALHGFQKARGQQAEVSWHQTTEEADPSPTSDAL
jgi:hypothetical protein